LEKDYRMLSQLTDLPRRVYVSVAVIALAAVAIVGSGTLAVFSDTSTSEGTLSTAVIDITSTDPLVFSPQDLLPGESSSVLVTIDAAVSTRDVSIGSSPSVSSTDPACTASLTVDAIALDNTDSNVDPAVIAAGESDTTTVTVNLLPGTPNSCQGVTYTVTVLFTGTGV
jgi:predicted ribosomally synthesized peptide with SipW-like signal peptide